jgi:hypothetical protein
MNHTLATTGTKQAREENEKLDGKKKAETETRKESADTIS